MPDAGKVAEHCEKVSAQREGGCAFLLGALDLAGAKLGEEFFYQSLPLCVLDAVWSVGTTREITAEVVGKYCNFFGLRMTRRGGETLPSKSAQESIAQFVRTVSAFRAEGSAMEIFENAQKTSSKGGILKSQAAIEFGKILSAHKVNHFQDLPKVVDDAAFEEKIKAIPGLADGASLARFFLLAGSDDLIKPDSAVIVFLEKALAKKLNPKEAASLLVETTSRLKKKHPHLTPRLLAQAITASQTKRGR